MSMFGHGNTRLNPYVTGGGETTDDLMDRFKNVLWGWVQYHNGDERLSPTFDETACARDWYTKMMKDKE